MKTILAPIDFSKVSEAVTNEAAALAKSLDARIVLLTVVQPPVVVTEYAGMMDVAQLTAAGEKNATRQLDSFAEKLQRKSVPTDKVQVTGAPVANILEQAEKVHAD